MYRLYVGTNIPYHPGTPGLKQSTSPFGCVVIKDTERFPIGSQTPLIQHMAHDAFRTIHTMDYATDFPVEICFANFAFKRIQNSDLG